LEISRRIYPVAVELREKHTADSSDHRFRRPYLSRSFAANSLTYLGRYDEAITGLRGALQEIAAVRQRFPLGQLERLDESVSTYRLAIALERSGRRDEAIQTMTASLAAAEALRNDEPKDVSYRIAAASQNSQFASLLLRVNRAAESVEYFRRAVELYENILAVDPAQKQAKADLAYAYGGLGLALAQTGNVPEAMDDERKAISSYEKLEPVKNPNIAVLRDYAETLDRSGEARLFRGTTNVAAEAKPLFQQSLGVWMEMRRRDALSKVDASKPEEIGAKIARCDAALK
jgi:tetratricopeptide (TPR) repeat protein